MAYYIISFILWIAIEGGSGCVISPTAVAVIAGGSVSLKCTSSTTRINGWTRGRDSSSGASVYQAANLDINNSVVPATVVDGYSVDDSVYLQVILNINNTSTVQADHYYCFCDRTQPSTANVTVLASKTTFSTSNQITDGEQFKMTCSVSINGTADASVTITDVSGTKVAEKSEVGTYPSTSSDLRAINLDYNTTADSRINQTYSCQVNLSDNSKTIYSEQVITSVHWVFVQNVQVIPVDKTRCFDGHQCAINQTLNCTAGGNPNPVRFQWTVFLNGSQFSHEDTSGQLNLTSVGNYTVQCTAFNLIGGFTYSNTSEYFKTEVTMEGPPTPLPDTHPGRSSRTSLIVGLVVGLGGGLIVIIVSVIVLLLFWKRKKRGTVCCNPDGNDTSNNQSVELQKTHSDTNSASTDKGGKKNGHITPDVLNKGSDEVTVVDNTLYSGAQKAKQIDPSDGGYASINEVMTRGK